MSQRCQNKHTEGVWLPGVLGRHLPTGTVSSLFLLYKKQIVHLVYAIIILDFLPHEAAPFLTNSRLHLPPHERFRRQSSPSEPISCLYKKAVMIHLKALYSECYLLLFPTNQIIKRPIGFFKSLKMFFFNVLGIK